MNLLELEHVTVKYSDVVVLREVDFSVEANAVTSLVGSNGAGKTSLMKTVSGIVPCSGGQIRFDRTDITGMQSHKRVDLGLVQVPEGRHVFPYMTVKENLELGSILPRTRARRRQNLSRVFDLFPRLSERTGQLAMTLSGGEQQMLAIGRGLMSEPRLLMLDEPSLGLAPLIVKEIFSILASINESGITILVVEQDVKTSLEAARTGFVLENGRIVLSGDAREILKSDRIRKAYLGL